MERITLNLIPKGYKPVCHASQFDNGREIQIDLLEGREPYELKEGDTVSLEVLKPDKISVSSNVPVTVGETYVIITVTQDMSDIDGINLCELRVVNGSTDVGSSNFYMDIEKSVKGSQPGPSRQGGLDASAVEIISTTYTTGG